MAMDVLVRVVYGCIKVLLDCEPKLDLAHHLYQCPFGLNGVGLTDGHLKKRTKEVSVKGIENLQ